MDELHAHPLSMRQALAGHYVSSVVGGDGWPAVMIGVIGCRQPWGIGCVNQAWQGTRYGD